MGCGASGLTEATPRIPSSPSSPHQPLGIRSSAPPTSLSFATFHAVVSSVDDTGDAGEHSSRRTADETSFASPLVASSNASRLMSFAGVTRSVPEANTNTNTTNDNLPYPPSPPLATLTFEDKTNIDLDPPCCPMISVEKSSPELAGFDKLLTLDASVSANYGGSQHPHQTSLSDETTMRLQLLLFSGTVTSSTALSLSRREEIGGGGSGAGSGAGQTTSRYHGHIDAQLLRISDENTQNSKHHHHSSRAMNSSSVSDADSSTTTTTTFSDPRLVVSYASETVLLDATPHGGTQSFGDGSAST